MDDVFSDQEEITISEETRYDAGLPVTRELKHQEVLNMLYLVAYDICDPKRLKKVAKVCEDFGIRVEKSVFECDLAPNDFNELWRRLHSVIDEDEDAVVAYRICQSCAATVESMGQIERPGRQLCYVF
ncbi:MAG: CRISPR-associated endonuclease Cas2 [Lentisphaerae bacterium]|nr:MAG: CRISPR-associated endonuclease Cas2 [Lentisphaerota bacterium]